MDLGTFGGEGAKEGLKFLLNLTNRVQPMPLAPLCGGRVLSLAGEPRPLQLPPGGPRGLGSCPSCAVPTAGRLAGDAGCAAGWQEGPAGQLGSGRSTLSPGFIDSVPCAPVPAPWSQGARSTGDGGKCSSGAGAAWGFRGWAGMARDGCGRKLKSSEGYQQGPGEQVDRVGIPFPRPTSCANLGESLSLSEPTSPCKWGSSHLRGCCKVFMSRQGSAQPSVLPSA